MLALTMASGHNIREKANQNWCSDLNFPAWIQKAEVLPIAIVDVAVAVVLEIVSVVDVPVLVVDVSATVVLEQSPLWTCRFLTSIFLL